MDVVLLTLTTLSLAAAAGFAAVAWQMGREERARSEARVAALATAMDPPGLGDFDREDGDDAEARVAVGSVFSRKAGTLTGRPAVGVAAVAVMVVTIAIGAMLGARMAGARPAPTATAAPLELVSMRHARSGADLSVSGLVRNPASGAAEHGVTAVVFAFDRAGGFVASGRAPLDVSALAPGDSSPFVVTISNVSEVARYRVSFRTERGIVRHVDRRNDQIRFAQAAR